MLEHADGGVGLLVVVDLAIDHAGVVINHRVHAGVAHHRCAAGQATGLVWGGRAIARALARTDVAPSTTVGDVADLLDVDVGKRTGVGVLVGAYDLAGGPVSGRQAIEVRGPQDAVNGRGRYPGAGRELDGPLTQAHAQRDDPLDHCLGRAVGARARTAGAVGHRTAGPVPIDPTLDGGPGALEPGSGLADGPTLLDHQATDPQTSTRGQGCVSVGHEESTFRIWLTGSCNTSTQAAQGALLTSKTQITPPQPTLPISTPNSPKP